MVAERLTTRERLMAEAGIVAAVGAGVAVLNLIDAGELPLGARLAWWIGASLAAWLVFVVFSRIGTAMARLLGVARPWGLVLAVPFSTLVVAYAVAGLTGGTGAMFGADFGRLWLGALAIGAGFFALFFAIYARVEHAPEPAPASVLAPVARDGEAEPLPSPGIAASPLHGRLDPAFPPILALSAEDHYVRVIAAGRSTLVLMTLAEAAALMPEGAGEQVHRSWWVARSVITGQQRAGRDLHLILPGGLTVPVSRSRIADLRAAGWLSL